MSASAGTGEGEWQAKEAGSGAVDAPSCLARRIKNMELPSILAWKIDSSDFAKTVQESLQKQTGDVKELISELKPGDCNVVKTVESPFPSARISVTHSPELYP